MDLHCEVESVIWNETAISWHHRYPTIGKTLFDPVVKDSIINFPFMGISSSGEYTCMAEYDGQVVLQYTVVLNVFRKFTEHPIDFLSCRKVMIDDAVLIPIQVSKFRVCDWQSGCDNDM